MKTCKHLSEIIEIEFQKDFFGDKFVYYCDLYNSLALRHFICKGHNCEHLARLYIDVIVNESEYKKHEN